MQKAVRSWCQNSPQLAAWVCQLHVLLPRQKKKQVIKKIKENLYAYILFQLGILRKKPEVRTGQSSQLCLAALRNRP